jgi:hypothetical protein
MVSYFYIIKEVLDQLFQDIPGLDNAQKYQAVDAKIAALSASYYKLTEDDRRAIDYSDPVSKFAYVYMYTACHAELIAQVAQEFDLLNQAASSASNFRATCIGGGPGSDVIGLLDAYASVEGAKNFHSWLIDRENSWGDCWGEISRFIDNKITVTTQVEPVNLLEVTEIEKAIQNSRRYLRADLITMSFVVSELYSFKDQAHRPLVKLLSSMRPGAYLLFIDNNDAEGHFPAWFDQLAAESGLEVEESDARQMSIEEKAQKVALGDYINNLKRQPKQNANVVFRICRKP